MSHDSRETTVHTHAHGQEAHMNSTQSTSSTTRRDLDGIPPMMPRRPDTAAERHIQRWLAGKQNGDKK